MTTAELFHAGRLRTAALVYRSVGGSELLGLSLVRFLEGAAAGAILLALPYSVARLPVTGASALLSGGALSDEALSDEALSGALLVGLLMSAFGLAMVLWRLFF